MPGSVVAVVVAGAVVSGAASVVSGASLSSLDSEVGVVVAELSSSSPPPQAANASTPAATMTRCRRVVMPESSHLAGTPNVGIARTTATRAVRPRTGRTTVPDMRRLMGSCVALVLGLSAVAVSVASPAAAASVPPGFADSAVASFSRPTAVEWLPDSRIVVLEQDGRLRVGGPTGGFSTAIDIGVCGGSSGERGLLGFTHDPAFQSNGFVYVYYTHSAPGLPGGCANRVSRFTLSGPTIDPASEVVFLDNISSRGGNHNGGNVEIGSDGFLYVSVGDAGIDPRSDAGINDAAQDLSLLNGKILRITLDGHPAPGNPLTGPDSAPCAMLGISAPRSTQCQEIFAWGLRNPYRFAFDRNDGSDRFFINDVGQSTLEEVDLGILGANYGWPEREGSCPRGDAPPCPPPAAGSGFTQPLTDYGRSLGTVITGGAFIPNGLWPEAYDGAYFFGDAGSGDIWVRFPNGSVDYGRRSPRVPSGSAT